VTTAKITRTVLLPNGQGEIVLRIYPHLGSKNSTAHVQPFRFQEGARQPITRDSPLVDMLKWTLTGMNQSPKIRMPYWQSRVTGYKGNEEYILAEFVSVTPQTSKEMVAELFAHELCAALMCHPDYPETEGR